MALLEQDIKRVKGLGFLLNRGTEEFSGRIITENGILTAKQMQCLSEAAEKFGNGNITFTSRLTVELPGISYDNIDPFIDYVAGAGMVTGGTGSKVRPVVSCKGTTCVFGLYDTQALAKEIHQRFYVEYHDVVLPHKFKIAVGGCPNNCVKPDLNDLGIVGQRVPKLDAGKCRGCKKCSVADACPMAAAVTGALTGAGLWGVEFFLSHEHGVYFSELSPRPHDTGMVTLAGTQNLNEFELHLRAVLGIPIPEITFERPGASAVILSPVASASAPRYEGIERAAAADARLDVRIFGKPSAREGRRMGVVVGYDAPGCDLEALRRRVKAAAAEVRVELPE